MITAKAEPAAPAEEAPRDALASNDPSAYLEAVQQRVIHQIRQIIGSNTATSAGTSDLLLDYPLRPAKGLRPAISIAVCGALGADPTAVLPSAAVLEMYHNAFLLHDDFEDGSLLRRGKPTLHRTHGAPTAVNVGDGLLALTLQPLIDNMSTIGLGSALSVMEVMSRLGIKTFEGQSLELGWIRDGVWDLTDDDYIGMVVKKTAWYSFVAPAEIGCVIASAAPETSVTLCAMMEALGVAFQIQDDLLNLQHVDQYGKEPLGDLWEGKRTLALLHAIRSADAEKASHARSILNKPRPHQVTEASDAVDVLRRLHENNVLTVAQFEAAVGELRGPAGNTYRTESDVDFVRDLITSTGGVEHARTVRDHYAARTLEMWRHVSRNFRNTSHKRFLNWLIQYVVSRER